MTRLSVCGLGVSCNEMSDTPMLLVVRVYGVNNNKYDRKREYSLYFKELYELYADPGEM